MSSEAACPITLTVAGDPRLARLVRMTAANVGALCSMSVDRIEDIRMAAEAAASACTDKKVAVVPTKTVPQAFSALFPVLPDSELEDVVAAMVDAISEVRDGEVTRAVRDSSASDGSPIHSGDVMGIIAGSIDVGGSDGKQVTLDCINRMQEEEEGDALTILAGEELSDEAFQEIVDAIEEAQPDLEIDAHRGEQPLYPVIFSIE